MNVRITWLSKAAGLLAVAGVLLGCEEKSAKLAQAAKADAAAEPSAAKTTNSPKADPSAEADLDKAPLRKIEPTGLPLSAGVEDVIKLAQSGVGDAVILAYIENSTIAYDLSAEDITYLNDVGVSDDVMKAMIEHGGKLREQEKKIASQAEEIEKAVAAAKQSLADEAKNQPAAQTVAQLAAVATNTLPPAPQYVGAPPPTDAPPAPPVNAPQQVNYFYSSLSPYGSWIELPAYGWCWQPSVAVVNTSWRPYCHGGRWLYSDCGWYWHSDYSWGWAPFHYGRWHHHPRCGWVWFPDSVWAPAWVTWRYTDGYCGWAPLPYGFRVGVGGSTYHGVSVGVGFDFGLSSFHFSWISRRDFCDRAPVHHILARDKAAPVYANSKVINNIVVGNNNTIINNGIGFEKISAVSRTEISKVSVRDLPTAPQKALKADRIERDGASLVVYRPQIGNQTISASTAPNTRAPQELRKGAMPPSSAIMPVAVAAGAGAVGAGALSLASTKPAAVPAASSFVQKSANERVSPSIRPAAMPPAPVVKPTQIPSASVTASRGPESLPKPAVASSPAAVKPAILTSQISNPAAPGIPQVKPVNERNNEPALAKNATTPPQPVTALPASPRYVGQPAAVNAPAVQTQARPQVATTPQAIPQTRITQQPNYQVPTPRPAYIPPQQVVHQPAYTPPPVQQYRPQPAPAYSAPRYEAPRSVPSYSPPVQQRSAPAAPAASSRGRNEK